MPILDKYTKFLNIYKIELAGITFNGPSPREHVAGTILAKQFDLATSIEILGRQEVSTAIPILLRSIYEASNDLRLHLKDENHIKILYLEELKREKTAAETSRSAPANSLLKTLYPTEESIQATIEKYNKANFRGKELGLQQQTKWDVFKKLDAIPDYVSMYAFLSKFVHTSPIMLERTYLLMENGRIKNLTLSPTFNPENLKSYLYISMEILLESITAFWSFKGIKKSEIIDTLREIKRSL